MLFSGSLSTDCRVYGCRWDGMSYLLERSFTCYSETSEGQLRYFLAGKRCITATQPSMLEITFETVEIFSSWFQAHYAG